MKYLWLLITLLPFVAYAQPTEVEMTPLADHYFVGDEDKLESGVNCFVIEKMKDYEKFFGRTRRADTPHFEKEWMLVLLMPSTKKDIPLKFNKVSMKAGSFIEVYCDLNNLKGGTLTYEHHPIAVCTIPKYEGINKIEFYEENKRGGIHELEIVEVR